MKNADGDSIGTIDLTVEYEAGDGTSSHAQIENPSLYTNSWNITLS